VPENALREFDRQVENLIRKGYPALTGLEEDAFLEHITPLKERLSDVPTDEGERRTFVIVISNELAPSHQAMSLVELRGKRGFTDMEADDLKRFAPLDSVEVPPASAYLVTDIDTGRDMLNVTPDDALMTITCANRSPLTLDEGVALVTHYPELLKTQNCFSLLGSRCGDRRVTALWIRKGGSPRLGWCWAGNPHTWLGSASCGGRLSAVGETADELQP
jgi:hypothetical protein